MKTTILSLFALLMCVCANSQTPVIALKARNLPLTKESLISDETFGLPSKSIDTIKKISDTKLVEIGHLFGPVYDTLDIKSYQMLKYWKFNMDSVKKNHPYIIFIGFDDLNMGKNKKKKKSQDIDFSFFNHPMSLFFLLFALITAFSFLIRKMSAR